MSTGFYFKLSDIIRPSTLGLNIITLDLSGLPPNTLRYMLEEVAQSSELGSNLLLWLAEKQRKGLLQIVGVQPDQMKYVSLVQHHVQQLIRDLEKLEKEQGVDAWRKFTCENCEAVVTLEPEEVIARESDNPFTHIISPALDFFVRCHFCQQEHELNYENLPYVVSGAAIERYQTKLRCLREAKNGSGA